VPAVGAGWHDRTVTTPDARTGIVGRENELKTLEHSLDEVRAGAFRVVVLSGEAGIGKTRLVDEFSATVPDGILVVRGQCVDLERDAPPYGPVVSVLRGLVSAVGVDAVREASGPAMNSLTLLLPELATSHEVEVSGTGGAGRLFDSVAALIRALARTSPIVMIVEDVHWADPATLELLRFLALLDRTIPVLLLLTFRTEDASTRSALRTWLPELDRNRVVERIELTRLTRRQARALVRQLSGDKRPSIDFALLYERSDGIPFFIEELLSWQRSHDDDRFPDTLRDILLARYDTVGDETQQVLRMLASGGVEVEHEVLVAVSSIDEQRLERAARDAVRSHILVIDETVYRFRHALVRDAVHEQLLPGERMRYHTSYAEVLSTQARSHTAASQIAYHWMAAHNLPRAFASALDAMDAARASYAFSVAARMGERAIDLWQHVPEAESLAARSRPQLMAETAYILRNAGRSDRAIALIDEAIALSSSSDAHFFAGMLRNKASFLANIGREGSIDLLRQALDVLAHEPRSVLRANVLGELAARLMLSARFAEAVPLAEAAFVEAESVGSRARMSVAANIRGMSTLSMGGIAAGLADLERAAVLAEDDDSAMMRFWVNYSDALAMLGRFEESMDVARAGAARASARGVERTSGVMFASNTVAPLLSLGRLQEADELLDRSLELDAPIGFSSDIRLLRLRSLLLHGEFASPDVLLEEWAPGLRQQARIDARLDRMHATIAAEIALECGRPTEAWQHARAVLEGDHLDFASLDLPWLAIAARAFRAGQAGFAVVERSHLGARFEEVIGRLDAWPTAPAYAAVVRAELEDSSAAWHVAAGMVDSPGVPRHLLPYARLREAEALAAEFNQHAALQLAGDAREEAVRASAGFVLNRLDALEQRLGHANPVRPASDTGSAPVLTVRERQVLDLIAEGLSNRQISVRLFISAKTASVHVSNILRKLGATSRTEAVFFDRSRAG
jgi:DNA-binding CsgD family transcriptional regulator/tetratricopeptide (TPR) repeat protein